MSVRWFSRLTKYIANLLSTRFSNSICTDVKSAATRLAEPADTLPLNRRNRTRDMEPINIPTAVTRVKRTSDRGGVLILEPNRGFLPPLPRISHVISPVTNDQHATTLSEGRRSIRPLKSGRSTSCDLKSLTPHLHPRVCSSCLHSFIIKAAQTTSPSPKYG